MDRNNEIRDLLTRLGFETDGSINLAEVLKVVFDENEFLDERILVEMDRKIRGKTPALTFDGSGIMR